MTLFWKNMHPLHQNDMNGYGDDTDSSSCCYFHPKQVVIGVCPLCLNERLLILASKQGHSSSSSSSSAHRSKVVSDNKKQPSISNLPKIFALGSLLNRFEFRHWKSDISDQRDACTSSQEDFADSFISIKFEDNGVASWEKGTVSKVSLDHCSMSWNNINNSNNNNNNNNSTMAKEPVQKEINKSVIEHAKQRGATLRWRKRIGHLLQLVRWKARSSNKGNVDGGVKVRKGWIRTLTKRGSGPKNKGIVV